MAGYAYLVLAFRPYLKEFVRRLTDKLFTVREDGDMKPPFLHKKPGNG